MSKSTNSRYKSAFQFLFKYIKPHNKWYIAAIIVSFIAICANLTQTYATQQLVDQSIKGHLIKVIYSIVAFLSIIGLQMALKWLGGIAGGKLSALCIRDMKQEIAAQLLDAEYGSVIRLKSGDMLSTLNADVNETAAFISGDLINLFSQATMGVAAFLYLLVLNPALALAAFLYTPLGILFTLTLNKKMNRLYPLNADLKGEALSVTEQALSCIPIIKSFRMERQIARRASQIYNEMYKNEMKISVLNAWLQPACSSTAQMPRLLYLIYAGSRVMHGDLSIGIFIALYSLLDYIIIPTVQLPFMLNALNRSIASIHRIQRMKGVSRVVKKPVTPNNEIKPSVKVEDVHFSYDGQKPVLTGFSFETCSSGIVVFKGASGSGKTTLLDLLCGLYHPHKGSIEICELDPTEYDISSILSVVSQDVYLFPASIRENIRCAKPEAGDDEVEAAAKCSGAYSFVSQLQEGYDTVVGDGYTGLSGGQRQRIALAQAILKNAPVWLLDEPTSALDSETEKIVLRTIREVSKEKLILVSAHRASFLEAADRVVALESEVPAECIC